MEKPAKYYVDDWGFHIFDAEKISSKIIADFPANFDCQMLIFLRAHLFELGNDTAMISNVRLRSWRDLLRWVH